MRKFREVKLEEISKIEKTRDFVGGCCPFAIYYFTFYGHNNEVIGVAEFAEEEYALQKEDGEINFNLNKINTSDRKEFVDWINEWGFFADRFWDPELDEDEIEKEPEDSLLNIDYAEKLRSHEGSLTLVFENNSGKIETYENIKNEKVFYLRWDAQTWKFERAVSEVLRFLKNDESKDRLYFWHNFDKITSKIHDITTNEDFVEVFERGDVRFDGFGGIVGDYYNLNTFIKVGKKNKILLSNDFSSEPKKLIEKTENYKLSAIKNLIKKRSSVSVNIEKIASILFEVRNDKTAHLIYSKEIPANFQTKK